MNVEKYFKSISQELSSLKDRVRNFIEDAHWFTDGEWKESVLRSVLSRNLPDDILIGRGFILTPTETSTQIDILLYSADAPVLFRDGDLVFVQPSAVRGIIEVKTRLNKTSLTTAVRKMKDLGKLLPPDKNSFLSIFSYDSDVSNDSDVLEILQEETTSKNMIIKYLCLGDSSFVRYWKSDPQYSSPSCYEKWHSYLVREMAYGYFIHNVLHSLSPQYIDQNQDTWFPVQSKEMYKTGDILRNRETDESPRIDLILAAEE